MKRALLFVLLFLSLCFTAHAIEIVRQKNVATYVVFPLVDADGDAVTSSGNPDSEIDAFADGSAPDGFADCTNEATEIGSTGIYYLSLAQSEMNNDYIYIQIKSDDAKTQHILIRTMVGDVANLATTDDGGTINVTSGKIDEVSALTGHTVQTGDSYAIVNSGTYGNSALKTLIDAVPTASEIQTELEENGASVLDSINDLLPASTIAAATDIPTVSEIQTEMEENGASILDSINDLLPASTIAAATDIPSASTIQAELEENGASLLDTISDKLPTNYIMGSSVQTDKDDDIDSILTDTGTTLEGHLTDIKGGTFSGATDSLEAIRDRGDAAWITATGFSTHSAADVWSVVARTLTALDEDNTTIDLDGSTVGGLTTWDKSGYSLSASSIDSIWDEVVTGHSTADSFGKVFDDQIDGLRAYGDSNWLTATGFSTHSAADVKTALEADGSKLDHLWEMTEDDGGVRRLTENSLEEAPSGSGTTAQQVWEYNISSISTAGYAGDYLNNLPSDPADDSDIDSQLATIQADLDNPSQYKATGFSTHSASDVWAAVSRTITGLTPAALADLFDTDSGTTYDSSVAGSVVKEIADNASAEAATDWTSTEKENIRSALGITGDKTTASGGQLQDIGDATDGDKEGSVYTGIENLVRRHGR